MVKIKIGVESAVAEYIRGKFYDEEAGAVKFPAGLDVYVLIYDLLQRRPVENPVDVGNLEIVLPARRAGKDPEFFNYLSARSQKLLSDKMKLMMWAELHDAMDENKHLKGIEFKETIYTFMLRYGIETISEDALLKNNKRCRYKTRLKHKRAKKRRKKSKKNT